MSDLINQGLNETPGSGAAKHVAAKTVQKQLASRTGAAIAKGAASAAGGPVGIALFAASLLPWKKIIIGVLFIMFGLTSLVTSLPGAVFNSIFHTNPFNNPPPVYAEEIERDLYEIDVAYEQEESVFIVVKNVLDEAYLHSKDTIHTMCMENNLDYNITMSHLVDLTVGGSENTETDAEQGPVANTIFNNEYNYVAIIAAYSVSINNMKPEEDTEGNHIEQPFELDKNCERDIKGKINTYYKNTPDKTHGNNVYRISYYGEEDGGQPVRFDAPEVITDEEGNTKVIHHYYYKPTIHNLDVNDLCTGAFNIDMEGHYELGASDTTNLDAISSMTLSHLAILYDMAGGTGSYLGGPLSTAEIAQVMNWVNEQYPDLIPARMSIVNIGLQSVGKIPYFLNGHADDGPYLSRKWGQLKKQTYSADASNVGKMIPYGLDCGSYVGWVYGAAGVTEDYMCDCTNGSCTNHWGTSRYREAAPKISESSLLPGDIILKTREEAGTSFGHIGIYVCRDDTGEPIILHCRTGKNGGSVLERRSIIDSQSDVYYWRRLPIDYESLNNATFPQKLVYKSTIGSILDGAVGGIKELFTK